MTTASKAPRTHGDGTFQRSDFASIGEGVVLEAGLLVFHPENITLGDNVYVGHQTILKGYWRNQLVIEEGAWIGQQCFFHSAGGLMIGRNVGIGPGVRIITSYHEEGGRELPILHSPLVFEAVEIGEDSDIGVGATLLPGTRLGRGVQVGAGAVVKGTFPDYSVVAGVPARVLKMRP